MTHPVSNKDISKIFDLCSKLMEILGENEFKIKTYSIAAFKINKHPVQFYTLSADEINSSEIISKTIKPKLIEILTTGQLALLQELTSQVPDGLIDLLQIKGLGAKKIKLLHDELGIQSIGELLYACQENRLTMLKGFGQKTQEQIIKNIQFIQNNTNKFLYAEVEPVWELIMSLFKQKFPENICIPAGEYVRHEAIVSSIEIFTDINFSSFSGLMSHVSAPENIQTDPDNLCIRIPHFPIIKLYELNNDSGIKMMELNSSEAYFKSVKPQIIKTSAIFEKDIYHNNSIPFIHPAQREPYNKNMNEALEDFPVRGLIHCHSSWSDGGDTIRGMAEAAIQRGMEYMVISDHSEAAFYANGLTKERISQQHMEIDQLNQDLAPFKIFKGIEADILYDGRIDYDEQTWKSFDVIIASVHSQLKMTKEKATERILAALDNPYVKILGHPTGRLLLSREGYLLDYETIFQRCREKNVVIEINAHPRRLDLDYSLINLALDHGLKLSINSDAHSVDGIEVLKYGILSAQKTGMTADDNLSSFGLAAFEQFIKQ